MIEICRIDKWRIDRWRIDRWRIEICGIDRWRIDFIGVEFNSTLKVGVLGNKILVSFEFKNFFCLLGILLCVWRGGVC